METAAHPDLSTPRLCAEGKRSVTLQGLGGLGTFLILNLWPTAAFYLKAFSHSPTENPKTLLTEGKSVLLNTLQNAEKY